MKRINSIGISPGLALAQLKIISTTSDDSTTEKFATVEIEWNRFKTAQSQAIEQLNKLAQKAEKDAGADFSTLFETHALMAEDPDFEDAVQEGIEQATLTAYSAVLQAGETLAMFFESMDDEYMRQRSADVRDVAQRIASIIRGDSGNSLTFTSPVILVADDLTPSQTIQLDKEYVKGFILYNGTPNGHTGILARNLGIPAVINPDERFSASDDGKIVFVDGKTGEIILEPDNETENKCIKRIENEVSEQKELLKYKDAVTKTSDGRTVKLYCNIGNPNDANDVIENGGEGVGLFRSEFLYLNSNDYPDEEEQFKSYAEVLKTLQGKEVIIRTCDIGSDKRIDYFSLPEEQNPALGTRAIRICLERKEIFKTQLRALYRASVYGELSIMFPMIASVWELEEAKSVVEEVKCELKSEGVPFNDSVKIGIMIETPAAAVISDELAKISDFFSIGSNDLTQYTLACDRNSQLGRYFDPKHPAVLRLIKTVAENAHNAGIPVGICGELAADEELTEFFLDIGIDELSVSPKKILPLRKRINNL
ncbi:MAG: phosphoenolpyruvate--protein phosphotransferase [Oscillospiraceae bacterium]|nr:phosphoenolpyruvate--protein phosphotransferase [Candidatus Ruminococcus equi]